MKAQMAARGWVLADGEPLKLEAVDNAIGTRQVTYQNMGQAAQATITDHQYTVQLKQNDQVIWHVTKTYGGPAVLQVKAGQTLEGVLAQDAKESLAWFDQVEIPERFQTNKTPVGFGTSDLVGP